MRRLAAVDWFLIRIFMPIFLFGIVMSVVHDVRGDFAHHVDLAIRGRTQLETVHAVPL